MTGIWKIMFSVSILCCSIAILLAIAAGGYLVLKEGITPADFAGKDTVRQYLKGRYVILQAHFPERYVLYDNVTRTTLLGHIKSFNDVGNHNVKIMANDGIFIFNWIEGTVSPENAIPAADIVLTCHPGGRGRDLSR